MIEIRDYFAAKALQSLIEVNGHIGLHEHEKTRDVMRKIVEKAYKYADAMIIERENENNNNECQACKEIVEIYVNRQRFITETAVEKYQEITIKRMYDCVIDKI